jgi:NitT/TauT family transport system substrate-binding protein
MSALDCGPARASCVLLAGLALTALAATPSLAAGKPVMIGELGIVADAPFYIGVDKGYFAEAKVEVELQRFNSATETTAPLSTNQIQVAGGGVGAGLFNAFARGWPVRVAMARTRDMPGYSSDTLILRNDLASSVATIKDLKGKKIAVNAPAGVLDYMVGKMLEAAGASYGDVEILYMSWPDMGSALQTKAIDAGTVVEPFAALYDERKIAFPFKRASDVLRDPPLEVSVILYSKEWVDSEPEQAQAFTIAYLKAVRDYSDAMKGGPMRSAVVDILAKHTTVKDKGLYDRMQWSYMDPNAELSIANLRDQQDWYAGRGKVPQKVDVEKMIDTRLLDAALLKLGRAETK